MKEKTKTKINKENKKPGIGTLKKTEIMKGNRIKCKNQIFNILAREEMLLHLLSYITLLLKRK